jgi:hypothetical protein
MMKEEDVSVKNIFLVNPKGETDNGDDGTLSRVMWMGQKINARTHYPASANFNLFYWGSGKKIDFSAETLISGDTTLLFASLRFCPQPDMSVRSRYHQLNDWDTGLCECLSDCTPPSPPLQQQQSEEIIPFVV